MSKKVFLSEIKNLVDGGQLVLSKEALEGLDELVNAKAFVPKEITDKGKVILKDMQDNFTGEGMKAKDIGERLGVSGRSVSGSIRSLIALGYVEKVTSDPVSYGLTDEGKNFDLDK